MEGQYLVHYGIDGQKWGVRRYQYEDGTYTEEGKKRRAASYGPSARYRDKNGRLTSAGKARFTSSGKRKNPKDMSDKDLEISNKRLQAENNYNSNIGRNYRRAFATDTIVKAGASFLSGVAYTTVAQLVAHQTTGHMMSGKAFVATALAAGGTLAIKSLASSFGGTSPDDKKKKK